jgi:UDP-glucose 4-epimerase
MSKILITGGAGFIGFHLAKKLADNKNNEVHIIDNLVRGRMDSDFKALINMSNVLFFNFDMRNSERIQRLDNDFDYVYHLAAIIGVKHVKEKPEEVIAVNVRSILNLLDWFVRSNSGKMFFTSTSEVYSWTQTFYYLPLPTPENVPLSITDTSNPRSTYALSKIFGEVAVINYCRKNKKPFTIVRYHNVYGPRMGTAHVIPEIYKKIMSSIDPLPVYSVDHTRAFCYIDDAINASIIAMESQKTNNETLNIGNDKEEVTIRELVKYIISIVGKNREIQPQNSEDYINRRCPDITKMRSLLGYEPKVTLKEGLTKTIDWYKIHFNESAE